MHASPAKVLGGEYQAAERGRAHFSCPRFPVSSVTLYVASVAATTTPTTVVEIPGYASDRMIANLTIDGENRTADGNGADGIRIAHAKETHASNLILRRLTGKAISVGDVLHELSLQNNTIVGCHEGIYVHSVSRGDSLGNENDPAFHETFLLGDRRGYNYSTVENNLIVGCSQYAIKIGEGSTALAWSPFSNPFGETPSQLGNPLVPVRNNMVWDCGTTPMQGDDWYDSGISGPNHYGDFSAAGVREIWVGGVVVGSEYRGNPEFVSPSTGDYRLGSDSPARAAGSPYRIDVFAGTETSSDPSIMRRSIGAFPSHHSGDYTPVSQLP